MGNPNNYLKQTYNMPDINRQQKVHLRDNVKAGNHTLSTEVS